MEIVICKTEPITFDACIIFKYANKAMFGNISSSKKECGHSTYNPVFSLKVDEINYKAIKQTLLRWEEYDLVDKDYRIFRVPFVPVVTDNAKAKKLLKIFLRALDSFVEESEWCGEIVLVVDSWFDYLQTDSSRYNVHFVADIYMPISYNYLRCTDKYRQLCKSENAAQEFSRVLDEFRQQRSLNPPELWSIAHLYKQKYYRLKAGQIDKISIVKLAMAMYLTLDETQYLLKSAGLILNPKIAEDALIMSKIEGRHFSIEELERDIREPIKALDNPYD